MNIHYITRFTFIVYSLNIISFAQNQDFEFLKQKAEHGDIEAQYRIGMMYGNGSGVVQDYWQSKQWITKVECSPKTVPFKVRV